MTSLPREFSYGARAAHEIDPTVNPVGVESILRCTHGSLDGLSEDAFLRGVAAAKWAEAESPGALREAAASWGAGDEFDRAAPYVRTRCRFCKGRGWYWAGPLALGHPYVRCECSACRGTGYAEEPKREYRA